MIIPAIKTKSGKKVPPDTSYIPKLPPIQKWKEKDCCSTLIFCFKCSASGPKCAKRISPTPLHYQHEPRIYGRMENFMLFIQNSDPTAQMLQLALSDQIVFKPFRQVYVKIKVKIQIHFTCTGSLQKVFCLQKTNH